MKRFALMVVMSLLGFSQSASAEGQSFYMGIGVAGGNMSSCDSSTSACNTFKADSQNSGHGRLIAGYDFSKYVGIEAGLSGLGSYRVQNVALQTVGTVKAAAFTLAAKGGYTFPHGFTIFGKLGLASVNTKYSADPGWTPSGDTDRNSTGAIIGAGGQYDLNETMGFRLFTEIVFYDDGMYTSGISGTTLMAVFRF